ncbi:MAG TPA: helix-turn-helix transcriptional regulator, partial [Roseiflexaceae bacterium]
MTATQQILATKFYLPPPTTTLEARPRLFDRLNAALRRPLTTVIAPAGFGKTTLVSTWLTDIAARKVASVAWLTLDESDDEPARFWTAVVAALQTIDPALGSAVLPLINTLTQASPE